MKLRTLGWIGALALLAACNNPVAQDDHARDVTGVEVFDAAQPNTRLAHTVGQGAARRWEGALPPLPVGQTRTLLVRWVDEQGQTLQLAGARAAPAARRGPGAEGLLKTPERVEKSLKWLTRGYELSVEEVIGDASSRRTTTTW
jgi:hypothetical protein